MCQRSWLAVVQIKHLKAGMEKTVHDCLLWCSLEGLLTALERMRLKNDDMLIEGPIAFFGGGRRVSGCSSARVKVKDALCKDDGRTFGQVKREVLR